MRAALIAAMVLFTMGVWAEGEARREIMTARQKERLAKADRVYLDIIALTDTGQDDPGPLRDLVIARMEELGYTIVRDRSQHNDVTFRVKCEQRKVWAGPIRSGGAADLPDSPSRTWKGPACQLSYLLGGKNLGWRKEVRTRFQNSVEAAKQAGVKDAESYALEQLRLSLNQYDFPVLVTADWGQTPRLLALLDSPKTSELRKVTIIQVLGDMFAANAIPQLGAISKGDRATLAEAATLAIGRIGKQSTIPLLVALLGSVNVQVQIAAAKALGQVGALNYDYSVVDPLLGALQTKDLGVKAEVVWSLGRVADKKAYQPLLDLQQTLHTGHTAKVSPAIEEMRKAVQWSLVQINPDDHLVVEN